MLPTGWVEAFGLTPETEQVMGDEEANALLHDQDRGYRSPFVLPERV
jgi:hypothetical protein